MLKVNYRPQKILGYLAPTQFARVCFCVRIHYFSNSGHRLNYLVSTSPTLINDITHTLSIELIIRARVDCELIIKMCSNWWLVMCPVQETNH